MNKTYDVYKKNPLWGKIEEILQHLEKNQDINITTDLDYVIGYIVKNLQE